MGAGVGGGVPGEEVLDGGIGGEELGGEVILANAGVGAGEWVLVVAEGAGPKGGAVVDAGVGVERGAAAGAHQGLVGEEGEVGKGHQRGAHHA